VEWLLLLIPATLSIGGATIMRIRHINGLRHPRCLANTERLERELGFEERDLAFELVDPTTYDPIQVEASIARELAAADDPWNSAALEEIRQLTQGGIT
jgi:hypothetical protein